MLIVFYIVYCSLYRYYLRYVIFYFDVFDAILFFFSMYTYPSLNNFHVEFLSDEITGSKNEV